MPSNQFSKRPQRTRSAPISVPAPVKGLNTLDPLAAMDPNYSLSCQNWIATPQGLSLRQGYRVWASGMPGDVTALIPYNAQNTSNNKLFAASVSGFYDVTNGGAVGAAVVSGLNSSNPYWQSAQMTASTSGRNFLMCVNGADAPRMYDSTGGWVTCTQAASPSAPGQFSNTDNNGNAVNISTFVDVISHQQRLWFVPVNSTKAYYCPIAAPSGQLNMFDFGPFFPRGGNLRKLVSWSSNMGSVSGVQSNLVAISDRGDVLIYVGQDPAVSTSWQLSASFKLGAPTGRRCTLTFESDLLYISRDGVYPMTQYISSGDMDSRVALTAKIAPTVSDLISTFGANPGFELCEYPGLDLVVLNIPQSATSSNFQFVYNTVTQGWTQFTGWAASTWGLYNSNLYFGSTGTVNLAFIGYKDGADISGNGGNNVIATALSAFNYFAGVPGLGTGVLKHVKAMKPFFVTGNANPTIRVGINTDFNLIPIIGSATVNPVTGAVWDNAIWDNPLATWSGSLATYNQWATPLCWQGDAIAVAMSISTTTQTVWTATSLLMESGGTFG